MNYILKIALIYCIFTSCAKEEETTLESTQTNFECNISSSDKSGRVLGFDILDTSETGSFTDSLNQAKAMGMEFLNIHLYWNSIEVDTDGVSGAPYVMGFVDPDNILSTLNSLANSYNIKLGLIISPIDIPGRNIPVDLQAAGTQFNDTAMATRFNALVDYLFAGASPLVDPSNVTSLSVGNEIDHYNWSGNGDSEADYGAFLFNIKSKVNSYGVDLNFTATLRGMISDTATYSALAGVVDNVSITYYPQNSSYEVDAANIAHEDFSNLSSTFSGTTFHLQEVGYQTSSVAGSSEAKQAEFFCEFFNAWDDHKSQITHASILRFVDNSVAKAEQTATDYGLSGNSGFIEYIRTLGLKTYDGNGVDKEAMNIIKLETGKRGW